MTFSSAERFRPRLALTMGDPASIAPEIILKALADRLIQQNYQITVIGERSLLEKTYHHLCQLPHLNSSDLAHPDTLSILDLGLNTPINWGKGDANTGKASFCYLDEAIQRTLSGDFHAIVTAPIAKSCWKMAGYEYPGQTEVLAQRAGVEKFGMLFVARSPHTGWTLRTLLATTHIPLKAVPTALTPQLLDLKLDLLIDCLKTDFGISSPTIAIAGLNPHSGEKGQLGTEEQDLLFPWLENSQKAYPDVQLLGLIPPDTLWVSPGQAWYHKTSGLALADAYLALYHDQGLIPVKLMAFDQAINTTIGLPFIRTSPDHGTAFDIAGKGIAKADSLKAAIHLANQLSYSRLSLNL